MKKVTLVPLAAAITALAPGAQASAPIEQSKPKIAPNPDHRASVGEPNTFYNLGDDLMGLVASVTPDGTLVAQHYSHSSHASHESHASHYSGS